MGTSTSTWKLVDHWMFQMILLCFQNALPWRKSWEKFVYRLIQLFSTTEILSKRRKIYSRMKENQSYANAGFIIENMFDKRAAFLLWFLANSMCMRVSNALFMMVILSRNFWLGNMYGSRLQGLQWIFVYPLEFGWFSSSSKNENWLLYATG